MEIILIQAVAFSILSGIVASNKNRSVPNWAVIGFFFGVFGFIASLIVSKQSPEAAASHHQRDTGSRTGAEGFDPAQESKKCPDCAERIKLEARVCRYCGYRFDEDEVDRQIEERRQAVEEAAQARAATNDGKHCAFCGKPTAHNHGTEAIRACFHCQTNPSVRKALRLGPEEARRQGLIDG